MFAGKSSGKGILKTDSH